MDLKGTFFNIIKWFYPGMRVKRYALISIGGLFLFGWGLLIILPIDFFRAFKDFGFSLFGQNKIIGSFIVAIGVVLMVLGLRWMNLSVFKEIVPHREKEVPEIIYRERYLRRGPKIVAVGGGTGLSTLLRGLKYYTSNITAIVTVSDSGGSSGRLRRDMGILPPGDIRNCLVALAVSEPLMTELFQYRFKEGEIKGHSFGNLLIAAMSDITGNFERAIWETSKVLSIRGRVLPSTLSSVTLCAEFIDGRVIKGEDKIPSYGKKIKRLFIEPDKVYPLDEAIDAIYNAEIIVLGPGSLYTSIISNLLVEGIQKAIKASPAPKVYVVNIMTQPGETDDFTASDHLRELLRYLKMDKIDYVLVNNGEVDEEVLSKYEKEFAKLVEIDYNILRKYAKNIILSDFVYVDKDVIRHNSSLVSKSIIDIIPSHKRLWGIIKRSEENEKGIF